MTQVNRTVDETKYVPKLEWKVLPEHFTTYDVRAIKKDRNYRLRKDVIYYQPHRTVAIILDEVLSIDSQIQLFIDDKPDGVYTFEQISRSTRKGKPLYEAFLQEIPNLEEKCRPKQPGYPFKRDKFWNLVVNHAHLTFVGI